MISFPIPNDILRGLADLEDTGRGLLPHRLPAAARAQSDDAQLLGAESQPSGVRLVFQTSATSIELDVLRTRVLLIGVPPRPDGTIDLLIDGELSGQASTSGGDTVRVDPSTGQTTVDHGPVATVRFTDLSPHDKIVEVWLPHHERIELVALRADAPITQSAGPTGRTWVHHGSSISQGSNAGSPSTTWPALAAAEAQLELVNLGLAGSAMLDQFTARAIRDQQADVISVKIGINLANADVFRQRAFAPAVHGFLDTVRDGHVGVPLIVIGPLYCPIHENTPGPGAFDVAALAAGELRFVATGDPAEAAGQGSPLGRLTLTYMRDQLAEIVDRRRAHDQQLSYVDGLDLYGPDDSAAHPLADNLHPDADTHRLIARRFVDTALTPLFGEPPIL